MNRKPCLTALLLFCSTCLLLAACAKSGYDGQDPAFNLEPEVLHFVARPGEIVESQTVQLLEAHELLHPWRVQAAQPWVLTSPEGGEGPGQVVIAVRTDGLAPGLHRSELSFVPVLSEGGEGRAELVVELEILEAGWQSLNGPFAGDARAVAWDPSQPDRILVGGMWNHLYLSTDGGARFGRVPLDVLDVCCDPFISDILMLPSGHSYLSIYQSYEDRGGVYRSDDGGTSWQPTALINLKISHIVAHSDDQLLAEGDGLWRSDDGGASWTELTPPGVTHALHALPTRPGITLATVDAGMLYLYDGSGFTSIDSGLAEAVGSFAADSAGNWFARYRVDNGETPALRRSTDGGQSWQDCAATGQPAHDYGYPYGLVAAEDALYILAKEVYRSTDGCDSFQLVAASGVPRLTDDTKKVFGLDHPDGLLLCSQAHGLLRRDPASGRLESLALMDHSVRALRWDAASQRLRAVTSVGGPFAMDAQGHVEGLGGVGLDTSRFASFSDDPRSSQYMVLGSNGNGAYVTEDGGRSWTRTPIGTDDLSWTPDIQRAPDDPDVIWMAGSHQGLWASQDGGRSFNRILVDEHVSRIAPIGGTQALINFDGVQRIDATVGSPELLADIWMPELLQRAEDGSLFYGSDSVNLHRSTDGGASFVELPFGSGQTPNDVAVDPNDPQRIWLAYDNTLFESSDGGQRFEDVFSPFPPVSLSYDADGDVLWVGTEGGGVYRYRPQL